MGTLQGKRALVCGSTQGIGHACAETLAAAGAEVTLVARNESSLEQACDKLPTEHEQNHDFLCMDFAEWSLLHDKVQARVDATGAFQILVNNTGGPPAGPAHTATPQAYLDAFAKHLICNQVLVQATLPGMREGGYGRIINIISTSVVTPIKGLGVSNTIRGAVANWARTLASELGPSGITVNNVLPGFTDTQRLHQIFEGKAKRLERSVHRVEQDAIDSIPTGRLGHPEEIAAVVGFLASPEAAYVNGVNLPVDGGRLAAS